MSYRTIDHQSESAMSSIGAAISNTNITADISGRGGADNSKHYPEQPSDDSIHLETSRVDGVFSELGADFFLGEVSREACLYQSGERAPFGCDTLSAVVSGVSKALSGNAIITAPQLHQDFEWLGSITTKPGKLNGSLYRKHRLYNIRGQVLAGGHVLPWQIGRSWRYSDLYTLLVEDLDQMVQRLDLRVHYLELISTFPQKSWQGRLSQEIANRRAKEIQQYVQRGIQITSALIESAQASASRLTKKQRERERKLKQQRARQRQLQRDIGGIEDDGNTEDSQYYGDESDGEIPKDPEQIEKELKQVLNLFIVKLLGIDERQMKYLTQISKDLGALISKTPALQTRVTKDFRVDPQQAL